MARRIGLEQIGAEAVILGTNEFFKLAKQVEGHIDGVNKSTKQLEADSTRSWAAVATAATAGLVAVSAAAIGVTTAVGSIGAVSVRVAAEFEANMSIVRAITQGTAQQMDQLTDAIRGIASTSVVGLNQAAQAAGELARGGVSVRDQLNGAVKAVTDLTVASAGELEIGRSATLVAAALNAFSLKGQDATSVVNAITAAAQKSSVTFVDIQRSFQQAAAVAGAFGLTAQETAAAIGVLGVAGLRGSDAGTSLKQSLIQLAKPTKQAQEQMVKYGISLFDASGQSRPFRDLIIDLQNTFGDLAVETGKITEAERNHALATIFGSDAIRAALVFAQQGVGVYDEMTRAQNDASFSAENLAKIMQDNLNAQFIILQNNIGIVLQAIGAGFLPLLSQATVAATNFLKAFNPEALRLIGEGFSAIASGQGIGDFVVKLSQIASPELAVRIQELVAIFLNIKAAITEQILPALGELKDTILSAFPVVTLTDFILKSREISTSIRQIAEVGTGVIAVIQVIAQRLIETGRAGDILRVALIGLTVIPLAGIAVLFGPIIGAIAVATVQALILVGAIGLLITNFDKVTNAIRGVVTGALGPFQDAISGKITPATVALGVALLFVAQVAIVRAATAFQLFALSAAGALGRATAAVAAFNTATLIAFATSVPRAIAAASISFVNLTRIVIVASSAMVASIVGAIIPALVRLGITALAALAAFGVAVPIAILVLGVLAAQIVVLKVAWENNWARIQDVVFIATRGIVNSVNIIIRAVAAAASAVATLPIIGGAVSQLADFVTGLAGTIGAAANDVGGFANSLLDAGRSVVNFSGDLNDLNALFADVSANAPTAIQLGDFNAQIAAAQARLAELGNTTIDVDTDLRRLTDTASTVGAPGGGLDDIADKAGKAGKALKEEALPAINGFIDALLKATRLQEFIDAFGDTGAKAINALIEAVVSNIDKDGAKAGEALHELIQDLRKANVPEWQELASLLNHAFAAALIERSDETINAAKEVLALAVDAMKAQGRLTLDTFRSAFNFADVSRQLGSDGQKLIESITDAIASGSTELVKAVGQATNGIITGFADKLPIDVARDFGRQIVDAVARVISERSPQAVQALQDLIRSLNFQAEIKKIQEVRDKAIAEAAKTATDTLKKIREDRDKELKELIDERLIRRSVEAEINSLKELNDARLDAIKQQQDWNRRVRELSREERDIRIARGREDVEAEQNRLDAIAEARKKAAEKAREALKSQGTPVGGLTITRVSGADDELKKELANIEARFAKEKEKREEKRKQEEADRKQRLADQNAEFTQSIADANALTNKRNELNALVRQLEDREEQRQHNIRVTNIVERAFDQITAATRVRDDAIAKANEVFDNDKAKLEFLRDLADTMFDGALQDVKDINTELDKIAGRFNDLKPGETAPGVTQNEAIPEFQKGGIVPGQRGSPKVVLAHGGEVVLSLAQVKALESRFVAPTPLSASSSTTNFNVSANYGQLQDPGSILLDLQALAAMAAR